MLLHYWIRFLASLKHGSRYARAFLRWTLYAGVTGIIGGFVGMAFHASVEWATEAREAHEYFLYFLPVAGIIIVGLYNAFNSYEDNSTDTVVRYTRHDGRTVPLALAPLIFISTVLTHLCGGSAGREGAALQLGGSIATQVGYWFGVDKKEMRVLLMCGMSALFSALFGTPVTAIFFALEVSFVGIMQYSALIPCIVASVIAYIITQINGIEPTRFVLANTPQITSSTMLLTVALAALCGILSIFFCRAIHRTEHLMHRIKNDYLRIIIGAFIIIALTKIVGNGDYNGAGMNIITRAVEGGDAKTFAFLLKILFTVVTIAAGFKGGEIVPTLFIGATFGCVFGKLVGMDAGVCAAVGMIAMFCGVLNCPLASIFLSIELFGAQGLMLFVIAVGVSYMFSGYSGLYGSQKIMSSKLRARYVNKHIAKQ